MSKFSVQSHDSDYVYSGVVSYKHDGQYFGGEASKRPEGDYLIVVFRDAAANKPDFTQIFLHDLSKAHNESQSGSFKELSAFYKISETVLSQGFDDAQRILNAIERETLSHDGLPKAEGFDLSYYGDAPEKRKPMTFNQALAAYPANSNNQQPSSQGSRQNLATYQR